MRNKIFKNLKKDAINFVSRFNQFVKSCCSVNDS